MFRSFAARLTAFQVGLIIGLLLTVTIGHMIAGLVIYSKGITPVVGSIARTVAHDMQSRMAQGQSPQAAARAAIATIPDFAQPWTRLEIFDQHHTLIAGAEAPQRTFEDRATLAVAVLFGLRPAIEHAGNVTIVVHPSVTHFRTQINRYILQILPFGVVAIVIAIVVGRLIAMHATRPLVDVTGRLRGLAGGDFTPRPIATADQDELGELARAYNDAAVQVQTAFTQRERAEMQMRQFIADASHELRTPLTVVMGYLDALKDGIVADPSRAKRVYHTMLGECRRMRAMIHQLIYLARLDAATRPQPSLIDASRLVGEMVSTLSPLAPNLEFDARVDRGRAMVLGDPGELREAVSNVVDNAMKYGAGAPIHVSVAADAQAVAIEVRDEGPGMSQEDSAHAFDRFHRGSDHGEIEGSGLGLAIAKRAVERMDGTISLAAEWGRGTAIIIRLPRIETAAPAIDAPIRA